jgi:hypothetical protein
MKTRKILLLQKYVVILSSLFTFSLLLLAFLPNLQKYYPYNYSFPSLDEKLDDAREKRWSNDDDVSMPIITTTTTTASTMSWTGEQQQPQPNSTTTDVISISNTSFITHNQYKNNNNNSKATTTTSVSSHKRLKKFLVIHIGVPKTGTTAIQLETKYHLQKTLAEKDHVMWVGKWAGNKHAVWFSAFEICLQRISNDTTTTTNTTTTHFFSKEQGDQCWKETMHPKKPVSKEGITSIITSFEEFSFQNRDQQHKDLQRLRHYLGQYYNHDVIMLVTYRRYHEWIFSGVTQTYHRGCLAHNSKLHTKWLWLDHGGMRCIEPWEIGREYVMVDTYHFDVFVNVDRMVPEMRSLGFDIQIMNYHAKEYPSAITQNFYCGMLGNYTPHTCQQSLQLWKSAKQQAAAVATTTTSNERMRSTDPSSGIINRGGDKHIYDAIVLALADRGWINTTTTMRHQAREFLTHHHVHVLGKSVADLPLICPPQSAYDKLLQKSLYLEDLMSKDLYGVEEARNSTSTIQAEHIQQFEMEMYTNRGFCWVDLDRLFQNVTSYSQCLQEALNRTWGPPKRYQE